MLEDDAERVRRFTAALHAIDPSLRLVVWGDARRMIREVDSPLGEARLISLDHDLELPKSGAGDPGDGVEVVKFLVRRPQPWPVIIHSINASRSDWMVGDLELAGWEFYVDPKHRYLPSGLDAFQVEPRDDAVVGEAKREARVFVEWHHLNYAYHVIAAADGWISGR